MNLETCKHGFIAQTCTKCRKARRNGRSFKKILGRMRGGKWQTIDGAETLDQCLALLRSWGLTVRRYPNELIAVDPSTGYIECEIRKED